MRMRLRFVMGLSVSLALSLTTGCQVPTSAASRTTPKGKPGAEAGATTGARPIPLESAQRLIELAGQPVELIGKVKLLSDKGMGIISNNSGALISNNGGGLISDKGMGLISDKGLGLVSNNSGGLRSYGVLQAEQEENLLADAAIEVLDATGQVLVGPDKKPITAVTDKNGNYAFKSPLPAENLVLRIRLYNGGQLFAFVTAEKSASKRTVNIDTASSLGASFVLARYVKKQQNVLNRLPESEAQALQQALEAARGLLKTKAPSYKPDDLVAQAERLQAQSAEVKTTFERIEAILLAGQKDLGNGLPATQVALATPMGLALDAEGALYVAEASGGRIRRVDAQGRIQLFAGAANANAGGEGQSARESDIGGPTSVVFGPDGTLYIADGGGYRIRKITPDGKLYTLAGDGRRKQGPVGVAGTSSSIMAPGQLALGPDGLLYFGEQPRNRDFPGRVLFIDAAGKLQQVPTPEPEWLGADISGLTFGADGTLYALWTGKGEHNDYIAARRPGASSWEILLRGAPVSAFSRLAVTPDGKALLFGTTVRQQVLRLDLTSKALTAIAGTGTAGFSGDGGPATGAQLSDPQGLQFDKQGRLWLNDTGNGLVRRIETDGRIVTLAGTTGLSQSGDSLSVSINQPAGLSVDPQGSLVIAEGASSTLKRLEGQNLTVIAGSDKGYGGDGGPATSAQLDTPSGLAYAGSDLYFADTSNCVIRKIDAAGNIHTVAGSGHSGYLKAPSVPASEATMTRPIGLAIGPNGLPTWSDNDGNQILRLTADGKVEVVAGSLEGKRGDGGDGGPATAATLSAPMSLVYDKAGNLFFCDTGNMRVRKIAPDGVITTVAGIPSAQVVAKLMSGALGTADGPALQAALMGPAGLALDASGTLYVSEVGTAKLSYLAGSQQGNTLPLDLLPKVPARIRKLTADGQLVTVAGPGGKVLNGGEGDNTLIMPLALFFDAQGRLIVSDAGNNQVKMVPKGAL